jgi:hypothetical protein
MGYNTTVLVLNDALGLIRDDPEFGRKLYEAILGDRFPADVSARNGRQVHTNAATVIETHHADYEVLVKIGGNMGVVVPPPDSVRRKRN